jgi:hypothetical protein
VRNVVCQALLASGECEAVIAGSGAGIENTDDQVPLAVTHTSTQRRV